MRIDTSPENTGRAFGVDFISEPDDERVGISTHNLGDNTLIGGALAIALQEGIAEGLKIAKVALEEKGYNADNLAFAFTGIFFDKSLLGTVDIAISKEWTIRDSADLTGLKTEDLREVTF